jgi:hypothetical protein
MKKVARCAARAALARRDEEARLVKTPQLLFGRRKLTDAEPATLVLFQRQGASDLLCTLDFNKVQRFDIEGGDSPNVVIEGMGWMCKQGGCQDIVKIGISAPRQEEARAIESKRHAIDFIKKACPGLLRD